MKKLPKQLYLQAYKEGGSYYYITDTSIRDVADNANSFDVKSYVGIYELKHERKLIQGKPELVPITKKRT